MPKRSGKTVKNIHIYCAYDYNSGTAWFDNISLRQEPVQTYAYNAKGNVSSVTQSDIATEKGEYASNGVDLTSYTAITGVKYSYTYNGKHDIAKEEGGGLTTTYTYDTSGNTTGSQMKGSDTDYTLLQSTMTPDRNHTASVTDTNGSQTSYTYNASTEQLTGTSTYNPETGKTISTNRVYNASNGRQTQMYIDGALSMSYAYKNGGLSSLTRKSYRNGIGQWQSYGLAKDVWGNTSAVTVSASTNGSTYSGTRTLASYTYAANNGNLTGMTCGNGDSISYSYDSFDRLIKTRYNDTGDEILYTYNAEGSLAQLELRRNSTTVGIFSYEYDSLGRLIRSRQTDGTNTIQRTEHLYDAANRLKQQNYTVGNKSFTTNYTYSSTDGLLTSMKTAQGAAVSYTYDANGIRTEKSAGGVTYEYITQSGKLVREKATKGSKVYVMDFFYDNNGLPFAVNFSSDGGASFKTYYYVLNLQGDVVKLVNSSGTTAAQYTYDAWGTVTSILNANGNEIVNNTSGSAIAFWNPLTYRGYIRDIETGFYYLQSRYYDPVLHRFINADLPEYTTLSSVSTASANLFAYCVNNPVNLHDENGEWPSWAKKLVAVVAVAAAVVTATVVTVATFGAGSVAGVAMISATATLAARTTEVVALQVKKGKQEGKSTSQIVKDSFESVYDNGKRIVGFTPATKGASITFNHLLSKSVSKIFDETVTIRQTLKSTGGKVIPYAFAALAWVRTGVSIFSDDPVKRASQRGYTLK